MRCGIRLEHLRGAELERLRLQVAQQESQAAQREVVVAQQALQNTLREELVTRFPQVSPLLLLDVQRITRADTLARLISLANHAADLTAVEQALHQAVAEQA